MLTCCRHSRNAPPPASETVIDSLPKRKVTEEEVGKNEDSMIMIGCIY